MGGVADEIFGRKEGDPEWLDGMLLLSHPVLKDGFFKRSVVLLALHNAEGALGVVLNHPTGKLLGDLGEAFKEGRLGAVPVFAGGPVNEEEVTLCVWKENKERTGVQFAFGVLPERTEQFLREDGVHVRAFLGRSGWTAGQLEEELESGTWAVRGLTSEILKGRADDELWRELLSEFGAMGRLLANEPEDLERN